jgi:hypothetical protein
MIMIESAKVFLASEIKSPVKAAVELYVYSYFLGFKGFSMQVL